MFVHITYILDVFALFICEQMCVCVCVCVCFWCLVARKQSNSSQGVQSAGRRPVIPTAWWKTEKLRCYIHTHSLTHTYTHKVFECVSFCALSVSWYPGSLWHVINACDMGARTEFSGIVLFSRFLQMKKGYFSKLIQSLNSQSMPIVSQELCVCVCVCVLFVSKAWFMFWRQLL